MVRCCICKGIRKRKAKKEEENERKRVMRERETIERAERMREANRGFVNIPLHGGRRGEGTPF